MLRPIRTRLRNPVATSPLLRKGGVHQRSKSGARANVKRETENALADWRECLEEECMSTTTNPQSDSGDDLSQRNLILGLASKQLLSLSHQTKRL